MVLRDDAFLHLYHRRKDLAMKPQLMTIATVPAGSKRLRTRYDGSHLPLVSVIAFIAQVLYITRLGFGFDGIERK